MDIYNSINDIIIIIDNNSDIVFVNDFGLTFLSYNFEEIKNKNIKIISNAKI